jgi:aminoacylase
MKLTLDDRLMIEDFQRYLRINTAQPAPAYAQAITLLQSFADRDGFSHTTITLSSGLPVLIISYPGSNPNLPALALNHHMDVVPVADESIWELPPFAGEITHDDRIIGRGTQDMKGVGIIHYHALRTMQRSGILPDRSIYIICVPDEEKGGFKGARLLVEDATFGKLNIGYVLDEGVPSGIKDMLYIKVNERKPLQLRILSKAQSAHASKLLADNPNHQLIQFLQHIVHMHTEQQKCAQALPAGQLLSAHITSLSSGFDIDSGVVNIIPETAYATIDLRIPPAMSMQEVITSINLLRDQHPGISYTISAAADERIDTPANQELFERLRHVIQTHGLTALSLDFEGATDLRHYQKTGIQGVGFTPFACIDNLHGTDEAISIEQLIKGKHIMYACIQELAREL